MSLQIKCTQYACLLYDVHSYGIARNYEIDCLNDVGFYNYHPKRWPCKKRRQYWATAVHKSITISIDEVIFLGNTPAFNRERHPILRSFSVRLRDTYTRTYKYR